MQATDGRPADNAWLAPPPAVQLVRGGGRNFAGMVTFDIAGTGDAIVREEFMRKLVAAIGVLMAIVLATIAPATAQKYPAQTIKIVVPFPPGGAADLLARAMAQKMGESLNQSVIIENRAGVAGTVGAAVVAKAQNDGYTIGLGTLSTLALNPFMSRNPLYDPRKDFVGVAMLTELPILMVTPTDLPGDFKGVIEWAKKNPGKMNFSSNGVGSSAHIVGEMMKHKFGFEASHVPYGGDVPIINAIIGQQVQMGLIAPPAAIEFVKAGRINAPATMGPKRSPSLPNTPSIVEIGYPDILSTTWFCIVAPAGTPGDVVALLNREINKALATPEVQQVFKGGGLEASIMELATLQSFIAKEQDRWQAEVKSLGIQVD